ncbi:tubby C-terminal domain-like protein [Planococcus alpniumensis]|uniref:tubby C-terminal domain-like protein n=1 Tax=Planococcus alpniumensis TaxID=2708345 RepID=UPI001B8B85C5|nr:hypothetical protein [Planococcus sp. MSAK28401]
MENFVYIIPNSTNVLQEIPIVDEQNVTLFLLKNYNYQFPNKLLLSRLLLNYFYTYQISTEKGRPLYSIHYSFLKNCWRITDYIMSSTALIHHFSPLWEAGTYSFKLNDSTYLFQKDSIGTYHLHCDGKKIAMISLTLLYRSTEIHNICVSYETKEAASLSVVLFHTFCLKNSR